MDLLLQLETIQADYSAALSLIEENKASLESLNALIASKDSELETKAQALTDALASVADKEIALSNLQAAFNELTATQKSAEDKALEIVASQGVAPIKVSPSANEAMSREDAGARYSELLGTDTVAAGRFFAQNAHLFI